jgi:asparagine synthase (glutamine-hydrolysing)
VCKKLSRAFQCAQLADNQDRYPFFLPDALLEPDSTRPDARVNQDLDELYGKAWEQFLVVWSRMNTLKMPVYVEQVRPETWESLHHIKTPLAVDTSMGPGLIPMRGQANLDADERMQAVLESLPLRVRDRIRNDWHPLNSALYYASKSFLANGVIPLNGDRTEMSHSIEGRPPILDHKVVELASRMPPSVKHGYFPEEAGLRSGHSAMRLNLDDEVASMFREKWILREAARPFISEEIYRRPKHAFLASNRYSIGGPVHRVVARLVTKENIDALGFLDWLQVEKSLSNAFGKGLVAEDFSNTMKVASWVVLGQRFGVATAS